MSEQHPNNESQNDILETDDWMQDDDSSTSTADSTIYRKESINPAKRRRLEAMREEQELMRDIKDVFDDYDFDD